ncbi:hypothetical protein ASC87_21485 [Rhizobacter sp. Root1221]|nr:hypothetical protein ASC87_21485 [Rhizobacter sp. Root1221]
MVMVAPLVSVSTSGVPVTGWVTVAVYTTVPPSVTVGAEAVRPTVGVAGAGSAAVSAVSAVAGAVVMGSTLAAGAPSLAWANEAGEADSLMRPTRRPSCSPPSPPPPRPAAGAVSSVGLSTSAMTRSMSVVSSGVGLAATVAGCSSGASCTMPSCVVRIVSPLCTWSPSCSTRTLPSAERTMAEPPQSAVTVPLRV